VAPSPPKAVESTTRRIVRRQLGEGSTDLTQRPQLSEPDLMVRLPQRSEPTTKPRNPLVLSAPGTGDSEDDDSTLVSCSDAHVCQAGYNAEGVLFKDNGTNQVRISLLYVDPHIVRGGSICPSFLLVFSMAKPFLTESLLVITARRHNASQDPEPHTRVLRR